MFLNKSKLKISLILSLVLFTLLTLSNNSKSYAIVNDSEIAILNSMYVREYGEPYDVNYTSFEKTNDGAYIIGMNAGYSAEVGNSRISKMRTDSYIEWTTNLSNSGTNHITKVKSLNDGNYLAIGATDMNMGGGLSTIDKLDKDGNLMWSKKYDETGVVDVIIDSSGNYNMFYATGKILKVDNNGNVISRANLPEYPYPWAYSPNYYNSFTQTKDGNYVTVGEYTPNNGISYGFIEKFNISGNVLWSETLWGTADTHLNDVIETDNGDYIAVGSFYTTDGDFSGMNKGESDGLLLKYSSTGNLLLKKSIGGTSYDGLNYIVKGTNGKYYISSYSSSTDGDFLGRESNNDKQILSFDANDTLNQETSIAGSSPITDFIMEDDTSYTILASDGYNALFKISKYSKPTMWLSYSTKPTNLNVKLTVNIDKPSEVLWAKYTYGSKEWYDVPQFEYADNLTDNSFTVTENGWYSVMIMNIYGGVGVYNVYINSIDTYKPTLPKISFSTNTDILTITPGTDVNSGVKETLYQLNGGAWIKYISPITSLLDGTYIVNVKSIDNAGNESIVATSNMYVYATKLTNSTIAVGKAESSKTQTDVNSARALVNSLPDCISKTSLISRLNTVQTLIDFKQTVVISTVNNINTGNNIGNLNTLSFNLPGNLSKANNLVLIAESSKNTQTFNKAKKYVDNLSGSNEKTSLSNRLNSIQIIN